MSDQKTWALWAKDDLKAPLIQIRRFDDSRGGRFYYWLEDDNINVSVGITTILNRVMPEQKQLTTWKLDQGPGWEELLNDSADYGTLMHQAWNEYLLYGFIKNTALIEDARKLCIKHRKSWNMPEKDLLAFARWVEDYKVEPIAIEAMLTCKLYGGTFCIATDLICKIDVVSKEKKTIEDGVYQRGEKKGQTKYKDVTEESIARKIFIIDYKSNFFEKEDKSFFDTQLFQLIAAEKAVTSNLLDLSVGGTANWSPRNWRKEPGYVFDIKRPSDVDYQEFDLLMALANHKGFFNPTGSQFVPPDITKLFYSRDYEIMSQNDFAEKYLKQ